MKTNISKEHYIITAHKIMENEGVHAVSIRRLGQELECNTANLYRYFDGLEELILYASLKYLRGYLKDIYDLIEKGENSLQLHYDVWECFARHSFEEAEIFNNLFFGKYSEKLSFIMTDYYGMFSDEVHSLNEVMRNVFINGDFRYRDFLMISRCVDEGYFTLEDARDLNQICIYLYKGYIKEILDLKISGDSSAKWKENFMYQLDKILKKHIHRP